MFKKTIFITVAISVTLLSGCAPNIKTETLDYGEKPKDYMAIIENFEKLSARDPDAIMIKENIGLRQMYTYGLFSPVKSGGGICYEVNGKNAYGGYVGFKYKFALIHNGKIIDVKYDNQAVKICLN